MPTSALSPPEKRALATAAEATCKSVAPTQDSLWDSIISGDIARVRAFLTEHASTVIKLVSVERA